MKITLCPWCEEPVNTTGIGEGERYQCPYCDECCIMGPVVVVRSRPTAFSQMHLPGEGIVRGVENLLSRLLN